MTDWTSLGSKAKHDWYLAPSLVALGNEINALWPKRDTASDGAVGDTSHLARQSDHNPDWSDGGIIRAIDVDKDGIDPDRLLAAVVGDQRVWYVIWEGHIYSRTYNWEKRPYDGSNGHYHHLHISIRHTNAAETDTSRWFVQKPVPPTRPNDTEDDPFMAVSNEDAAKIGAAVAAALVPQLDKIEQKYTVADNRYDAQAEARFATAQAEATHILGGGKPHTPDELNTAFQSVWNFLRPLWA